ncbi:hypothetical protein DPMN_153407 [Dreissena polymorpha]|uniref:Secreted protein n=1 Tax=Dreissena polymorpha TaxID=45954 RepID=A0A9D4J4S7_DREPO|nr:hypothetical protein DPMN_153407 [Dreissena polymorpha]
MANFHISLLVSCLSWDAATRPPKMKKIFLLGIQDAAWKYLHINQNQKLLSTLYNLESIILKIV